jgi:hypothetical protein
MSESEISEQKPGKKHSRQVTKNNLRAASGVEQSKDNLSIWLGLFIGILMSCCIVTGVILFFVIMIRDVDSSVSVAFVPEITRVREPTATVSHTSTPTPVLSPTPTPVSVAVIGEKFLKAINDNNLDLADEYICESQQKRLVQRLLREKSMYPKGVWIEVVKTTDGGHGVTSPGLTNIKCEESTSGEAVCTFLRPEASCTMSIRDGKVAGFNCSVKGTVSTEVTFKLEEEKICSYVFREP